MNRSETKFVIALVTIYAVFGYLCYTSTGFWHYFSGAIILLITALIVLGVMVLRSLP